GRNRARGVPPQPHPPSPPTPAILPASGPFVSLKAARTVRAEHLENSTLPKHLRRGGVGRKGPGGVEGYLLRSELATPRQGRQNHLKKSFGSASSSPLPTAARSRP